MYAILQLKSLNIMYALLVHCSLDRVAGLLVTLKSFLN